jgi:1-pyrroline-5-carboxylate dehydrogenase
MLMKTGRTSSKRYYTIGNFKLPAIAGEPFKHYSPNSPERIALVKELTATKSEVVEIPCIVNGKEYYTNDTMIQTMPSDHQHKLAIIHKATPEIIQTAINTAIEAKASWANMPFEHRAMIFRKAADLIAGKYRPKINAATMLGTGKTCWQAEIDSAVETIDFLRLNTTFAEDIYKVQPPLNSPNVWNRLEYRELEGFIVAISPFNFCAIGANLPSAPALMGNTCLWKPASTSVLSNYVTYKIFEEAGLPPGVISFLPSAGKVAGAALDHKDFGGLHFTGSTQTFNTLWRQIGNNLDNYKSYPRIVGETGGKNFHLIHPSADVEHAVYNTVRAAFEYQGQKCSACSRLYVPKSLWIKGGFRKKLVTAVKSIDMGQPDDLKTFMTAVIDANAFKDHTNYINGAKNSPECEIITGGNTDNSIGYFVEPTVIVTTNPKYQTMQEEIFGPVLSVYVYNDSKKDYWDEVVKLVDTTSGYALTGAIFAADRSILIQTSEALRHACGNLYLNDKSTGAVVGEQPFGGSRASGTNDKAGSHLNLLRWVSARTIKENTVPLTSWTYPHMQ